MHKSHCPPYFPDFCGWQNLSPINDGGVILLGNLLKEDIYIKSTHRDGKKNSKSNKLVIGQK